MVFATPTFCLIESMFNDILYNAFSTRTLLHQNQNCTYHTVIVCCLPYYCNVSIYALQPR